MYQLAQAQSKDHQFSVPHTPRENLLRDLRLLSRPRTQLSLKKLTRLRLPQIPELLLKNIQNITLAHTLIHIIIMDLQAADLIMVQALQVHLDQDLMLQAVPQHHQHTDQVDAIQL